MSDSKFLGVCILAAAVIVSAAILYSGNAQQNGRYQFHPSSPPGVIWVMDTVTGEIKTQ
jgi:hypothetical protein